MSPPPRGLPLDGEQGRRNAPSDEARERLAEGWEREPFLEDAARLSIDGSILFHVGRAKVFKYEFALWCGERWIEPLAATDLPAAIAEAMPLIDRYLRELPGKLAEVTNPDTEQA